MTISTPNSLWVALVAGLLLAPAAFAARPAPVRAPSIQVLLDCRSIADAPGRLACFDKAVAALDQAEHSGDLVTIDRAQRREVRRQAFGLVLPSLAMFDRGEKADEADRIDVELAEVRREAHGRWLFKLPDGAMWRQIDDIELARTPHAGSKGMIRRGALGGYFMNVDSQPAIRVHRDN